MRKVLLWASGFIACAAVDALLDALSGEGVITLYDWPTCADYAWAAGFALFSLLLFFRAGVGAR